MSNIKLDHFITATDTDDIDAYLQEYRRGGFLVVEQTVKHSPGLRNGFVRFGPEYLEFVWVEDEALFEQGADTAMFPQFRELRAAHRPFAIGLVSDDVQALHDEWTGCGYELPQVTQGKARDAAAASPPAWSFQGVPDSFIDGVLLFALTYHTRQKDAPSKIQVAPNSTYAISGVTFATEEPDARARAWRDLLVPGGEISGEEGGNSYEVYIRPHFARWIKPDEYQEQYGISYKSSPHPFGELAVIHILANDLDKAEEMVAEMGRNATRLPDKRTGADTVIVPPDERDGFTFAITERPVEEWLRERVELTGERLELEEPG
jgi:hypothetical protein